MTHLPRAQFAATMSILLGVVAGCCGEPSFSLAISLAQETVKAGSAVTVKVAIKNITGREIRIGGIGMPPGDDVVPANCRAAVTDSDGGRPPYTEYGARMWAVPFGTGVEGRVIFAPMKAGGQGDFDLILSRTYDLRKPGKYSVEVAYPDYDGHVIVKSNKITLTITE